jgi:hypothetical protein
MEISLNKKIQEITKKEEEGHMKGVREGDACIFYLLSLSLLIMLFGRCPFISRLLHLLHFLTSVTCSPFSLLHLFSANIF